MKYFVFAFVFNLNCCVLCFVVLDFRLASLDMQPGKVSSEVQSSDSHIVRHALIPTPPKQIIDVLQLMNDRCQV